MSSCDLLSNSYLCSICDSSIQRSSQIVALWFAFKFLPLQYLRQRSTTRTPSASCCDLLSNSYLCSICDSPSCVVCACTTVVICFQILTFAVSATAKGIGVIVILPLWFAFKFLPLQYLRQRAARRAPRRARCDLLSNSYLCSICDSEQAKGRHRRGVVICFQILTFAVSATARACATYLYSVLWFAFKFLPLQYLRQPKEAL